MDKTEVRIFFTRPTPETFMFSGCWEQDGMISGILRMNVCIENIENEEEFCDYFEMITFNRICLSVQDPEAKKTSSAYYRYLLLFDIFDYERIRGFLCIIANKCTVAGDLWKNFMQYGESDYENKQWFPVFNEKKTIIAGCQPSYSWSLEPENPIESSLECFDRRIIIRISWLFEGQTYTFQGYWYITSLSFLEKQFPAKDPYYRRFIILTREFHPEQVNTHLEEKIKYLSCINHKYRFIYLQHHFEYNGQPMFYER